MKKIRINRVLYHWSLIDADRAKAHADLQEKIDAMRRELYAMEERQRDLISATRKMSNFLTAEHLAAAVIDDAIAYKELRDTGHAQPGENLARVIYTEDWSLYRENGTGRQYLYVEHLGVFEVIK